MHTALSVVRPRWIAVARRRRRQADLMPALQVPIRCSTLASCMAESQNEPLELYTAMARKASWPSQSALGLFRVVCVERTHFRTHSWCMLARVPCFCALVAASLYFRPPQQKAPPCHRCSRVGYSVPLGNHFGYARYVYPPRWCSIGEGVGLLGPKMRIQFRQRRPFFRWRRKTNSRVSRFGRRLESKVG